MPENRGAVGAETRSRRRKPRRRKGMGRFLWGGEPPQPTRGFGERCKLSQRGPGLSPGRKQVLMHLEPV